MMKNVIFLRKKPVLVECLCVMLGIPGVTLGANIVYEPFVTPGMPSDAQTFDQYRFFSQKYYIFNHVLFCVFLENCAGTRRFDTEYFHVG